MPVNPRKLIEARGRVLEIAILSVTIIITAYFYINTLWKGNGLIVGIDAPYYMIQVREILSMGMMKHPDPPILFYLMSLVTLLVGNIERAFVLGASLLAIAAALPFYVFIKKVANSAIPAYMSLLLIYYSPDYLRMLGDFVKNQFGIVFIGLSMIILYYKSEAKYKNIALFAVILLAGLTHILDHGIIILLLVSLIIYRLAVYRALDKDNIIVLSAILAIDLMGYLSVSFYFGDLSRAINFVQDLVMGGEKPPSPDMMFRSLYQWVVLIAGLIYLADKLRIKDYRSAELMAPFLAILFFLILPWPSNWYFRFLLMSYLPISIIIGIILSEIENKYLLIMIGLLIISMPIRSTIDLSPRLRPTITLDEYNDLHMMSNYILEDSFYVIFRDGAKRYWVEYILDPDLISGRFIDPGFKGPVYWILPKNIKPPPFLEPVYTGKSLALYRSRK